MFIQIDCECFYLIIEYWNIRWGDAGDNALVTLATVFFISNFHLFLYLIWRILYRHKGFFKRPHIWNCPQCQVQVKFHPRFPYQCICFYFCLSCLPLSLYNTRSDETGGVPRLGSGMIGPTSLLHSRHWVLFSSIFFLSFKSNYHSDQ